MMEAFSTWFCIDCIKSTIMVTICDTYHHGILSLTNGSFYYHNFAPRPYSQLLLEEWARGWGYLSHIELYYTYCLIFRSVSAVSSAISSISDTRLVSPSSSNRCWDSTSTKSPSSLSSLCIRHCDCEACGVWEGDGVTGWEDSLVGGTSSSPAA